MKGYYDIAGDGGSDVLAQVQAQDESVARSLADVRNLVAIGSGKGGTEVHVTATRGKLLIKPYDQTWFESLVD